MTEQEGVLRAMNDKKKESLPPDGLGCLAEKTCHALARQREEVSGRLKGSLRRANSARP